MSFAAPAKRNSRGDLVYEIDLSHSRLGKKVSSRSALKEDNSSLMHSKSPKKLPFRRTKARDLQRIGTDDASKERNAKEILRQLHKLGQKNLDWTPFSPTSSGLMKRDATKAPHSVYHTVFNGGRWVSRGKIAASSSSSASSGSKSKRTRSASPTPSVASRRSNLSDRSTQSMSPVGSLSLSQLGSPTKSSMKRKGSPSPRATRGPGTSRDMWSPSSPWSPKIPPLSPVLKESKRSIYSPSREPASSKRDLRSRSPAVGFRDLQGATPRSRGSISKFEYSIEVENSEGGTDVLTQSLGDEKREAKNKFYVAGFNVLKTMHLKLLRDKSSILHRYYMAMIKRKEAQARSSKQEPNYELEDEEENELLEKLHLVRLSCKFLGALHVQVKSKHDLVKLDACALRHSYTHTLASLHVFARNLRRRKFAVMVCTLRQLGHRGIDGLLACARRQTRYRHFTERAYARYFRRHGKSTLQYLQRRCLYGRITAQKRDQEAFAMTLRTKASHLGMFAGFLARRKASAAKARRQRSVVGRAFMKAHSANFGLRRWKKHVNMTRRTSPRRMDTFLRLNMLLNGYCALRTWRDSHSAHHEAFGSHMRRAMTRVLVHLLAWKERRRRHHRALRNAFWKGVHCMATRRLGYWRSLTTSNLIRERSLRRARSAFRSKALQNAIQNWRKRVAAHNQYRMERKNLGSAFEKVISRRTGGSKMIDGRALMRRYLQSWVSFMHQRVSHFEENSLRKKAIRRLKLRSYLNKLKKATILRPAFEDTPLYQYIVDKDNRLSRHRKRVAIQALYSWMEHARIRVANSQLWYYRDRCMHMSFVAWRLYFQKLERLRDTVYIKGSSLNLEKALHSFKGCSELSVQRKAAMRNMRLAADKMRMRHLAGLVFKGLIMNHEDLLAEYEMANKHYLSRFMKNGFRHAHTFRRIRRHTKYVLARVRKNHFHFFLNRWRHHMKLKRRARRALTNTRQPKVAKKLLLPSSGNRHYFKALRKMAKARGLTRKRTTKNIKTMQHHWKLGAALTRILDYTMRCVRHKRIQNKLNEEHHQHALGRVVALLKKKAVTRFGLAHSRHKFRRLDQVYWLEHTDRLRNSGLRRLTLEYLVKRTKSSRHLYKRLKKHSERRKVKLLKAGLKSLKNHTRLMLAEMDVYALRRRLIFAKWREKYYYIHVWHSASKSIMFKNTAFMLKRAFREWKADCAVERGVEFYVHDREYEKTRVSLTRLRVFARRAHKAKSLKKHANEHFLAGLVSSLCRELRLNMRAKRLRHVHLMEMDKHRDMVRKRYVMKALVALQVHCVSIKFHVFKQMDNLMFALKQVTNRNRYARMLRHIATDAKVRKCWLRMRKVLNRSRVSARKAEAVCRETGKPAPWAMFMPLSALEQSADSCRRFREVYTKEMAVRHWFRYITYCCKAGRVKNQRFDEWHVIWQKRQVLFKLRSYRSGRVRERNVNKATCKLRHDFALRNVVTRLTLNNFGKWTEQQKYRLVVDKKKALLKLRSLRLLQGSQ